jgi:hypothetical protein
METPVKTNLKGTNRINTRLMMIFKKMSPIQRFILKPMRMVMASLSFLIKPQINPRRNNNGIQIFQPHKASLVNQHNKSTPVVQILNFMDL